MKAEDFLWKFYFFGGGILALSSQNLTTVMILFSNQFLNCMWGETYVLFYAELFLIVNLFKNV